MQRESYFSDAQQAGQMFDRKTAIELRRRKQAINVLELQEYLCQLMNNLNKRNDACAPDLEQVQSVCQDAPGLDYIVARDPHREQIGGVLDATGGYWRAKAVLLSL